MNRETRRRIAKAARKGRLNELPRNTETWERLAENHRGQLDQQDNTTKAVAGPRIIRHPEMPGGGRRGA